MPDNNLGNFEININANTGGVEQSLSQIGQGMDDVKKKGQGIDQPVQSLKQALREANLEAQRMAVQYGRNSTQFVDAAKHVAELKDEFSKYKQTVDAFNPENKLAGFVSVASGATMAVRGWTGAMELLGVESDKSTEIIRKMMALREISEALESFNKIKTSFQAMGSMLGFVQSKSAGATKQIIQQTEATEGAAVATETQTAATEAQAVATEGATVATKGLGLAFKAIGIGLIIAAVAALIEHWDDIKESLAEVFPWINQVGDGFNKFKEIAVGVGNVMLKAIVAPFKLVMGVIQGFMSGGISGAIDGAKKAIADSYDVIDNFEEGRKMQKKRNDDNDRKEDLKAEIEKADMKIKIIKAKGEESYNEERENLVRKLELAKLEKKDVEKAQNDLEVLDAEHAKKLDDEAADRKKKADEASKNREQKRQEALKKIQENWKQIEQIDQQALNQGIEARMSAHQKELFDAEASYDANLKKVEETKTQELAYIAKYGGDKIAVLKKYAQVETDLLNAKNEKQTAIDAKYYKDINDFILSESDNAYVKQKAAIEKKYDDEVKKATDTYQILALLAMKKQKLDEVDTQQKTTHELTVAKTNTINTETNNTVFDADSPDQVKGKMKTVYDAKVEEENAQFAADMARLNGDHDAEALAKAQHLNKLKAMEKAHNDDIKNIDKQTLQGKLDAMKAVGDAMGALGNLFGKQTAANKVLNVANAVMNTAVGITEVWRAKSVLPEPFGTAAKVAATVTAAASGFAAVKSILSANVPGGGGASASPIDTAPIINAVDLSGQNQGPQDVRVVNPQNQAIKAYITPRDLQDHEDQKNFMNKLSSF